MNLLTRITHQLQAVFPEGEARAMARIVLEDGFGLQLTDVLMGKDSELSADDLEKLQNIVTRLLHGEPIQYVMGTARFCGHPFIVRPGCLIPRPETEKLVQQVLHHPGSVLDIGTGSGCIAITLALAGHTVTAWDVSEKALTIARENAQRLGADVFFEKKDILHIEHEKRLWDIMVSNPPYVRQSEATTMSPSVLEHEPHLALFVPDDDPLLFYRAIGQFALTHLNDGGKLFLETNQWLGQETTKLLSSIGFKDVKLHKDQFGNNRMISCQL